MPHKYDINFDDLKKLADDIKNLEKKERSQERIRNLRQWLLGETDDNPFN